MKCRHIKLIMELIFIFILPFIFICFTSEIQVDREFTYDNNGNYEISADTKKLSFDNSIIKYTKQINIPQTRVNILLTGPIQENNYYIYTNYIELKEDYMRTIYTETYTFHLLIYDNNYLLTNDYTLSAGTNYTIPSTDKYYRLARLSNTNINDLQNTIYYIAEDHYTENTIWGNIKELLINSLDLNDNILMDLIICYTILWFVMFFIWHILYFGFDSLFHLLDRKRE